MLKVWTSCNGDEKVLVKMKHLGWGKDLKVLTLPEFLLNNNYWPIQWYYAYIDACIIKGGKNCVLY